MITSLPISAVVSLHSCNKALSFSSRNPVSSPRPSGGTPTQHKAALVPALQSRCLPHPLIHLPTPPAAAGKRATTLWESSLLAQWTNYSRWSNPIDFARARMAKAICLKVFYILCRCNSLHPQTFQLSEESLKKKKKKKPSRGNF